MDSFQENFKNQKLINDDLRKRNNELVLKFNQKDKENIDLRNSKDFYKDIIKSLKEDKCDLIKFVSDKIYIDKNKQYESISKDFYSKGIFNKAKYKLSLKPLINYSKRDISNALDKINREMDESAEQFYKDNKNEDYSL